MSDAFKKLREKNEREDAVRTVEEQRVTRYMLHVTPAIPALFWLGFSDEFLVDVIGGIDSLASIREVFGANITAYAIVGGYFLLIAFFRASFYRAESAAFSITVTWLAWIWFYFSIWKLESLREAFIGLLILSLLSYRIVTFLSWCYEKLRRGMFLGRDS